MFLNSRLTNGSRFISSVHLTLRHGFKLALGRAIKLRVYGPQHVETSVR
jgi:hypothetical protein